jgi:hypothetical protein
MKAGRWNKIYQLAVTEKERSSEVRGETCVLEPVHAVLGWAKSGHWVGLTGPLPPPSIQSTPPESCRWFSQGHTKEDLPILSLTAYYLD